MADPAVIPSSVHKDPPIRTKRGRMVILTPQEMLTLLKAAKNRSTRDWAMILLAYRHGLRASEVCGIKSADVDMKAGSISIRRLKGSLQTIQPLYQHRGQPLLDETTALRAWLRKRRSYRHRARAAVRRIHDTIERLQDPLRSQERMEREEARADGSDYLFTSQKGGKLGRTQFFRNFQSIAEDAGLPIEKRHPHVLKHSLASHLVAGNVNLALVRQALGHRSIRSTMAYIGTTDAQAAEAAQAALMSLF
jgi:integrase